MDEAIYSGFYYKQGSLGNTQNYLYSGAPFWTVTPEFGISSGSSVYAVYNMMVNSDVSSKAALRPVINLVAGSLTEGDGIAGNPYRVS